jgi:membrane protein YdbS with pleckstrin-like domain
VESIETPEGAAIRLRPPRHRVSRKAVGYWTVGPLVFWLLVTGGQAGVLLTRDDHPGWLPATLVASVVLGALHVLVMPSWRYRVHRWEITGEAVYTQSGWLKQEWRIAPISRIQTVDVERDAVEQLFGLAKVTVTTASAAGPLHIRGLDHEVALRVVAELTATTQATPGDAT